MRAGCPRETWRRSKTSLATGPVALRKLLMVKDVNPSFPMMAFPEPIVPGASTAWSERRLAPPPSLRTHHVSSHLLSPADAPAGGSIGAYPSPLWTHAPFFFSQSQTIIRKKGYLGQGGAELVGSSSPVRPQTHRLPRISGAEGDPEFCREPSPLPACPGRNLSREEEGLRTEQYPTPPPTDDAPPSRRINRTAPPMRRVLSGSALTERSNREEVQAGGDRLRFASRATETRCFEDRS